MYQIDEKLPVGAELKTLSGKNSGGGESVKVVELISDKGGQGDVYRVTWKGNEMALKWYNRTADDVVGSDQYTTIGKLVNRSNPNEEYYIWPEVLVTENGTQNEGQLFGYLMQLLPSGYSEMEDFLRSDEDVKQQKFTSFHSMIWAGMHVVAAVQSLHLQGLSYKDLNPGNIVIEPKSGKVKMVDCDNISVDGAPCGISGMRGYMAPEIVRSNFRETPTITSDQFSLAIVLFRLFYMDHPMEGRFWANYPLITDKVEDELYCRHPIYSMSTKDDRNRPNDVYGPNVQVRMMLLPRVLMEGFEQTFVEGVDHKTARTPENKWLQILASARDQLVFLDGKCENDRVIHYNVAESIPAGCLRLTVGAKKREIALYPMQSIWKDTISNNVADFKTRYGRAGVMQGKIAIQNMSEDIWNVYDPNTKKINPVAKGGAFVVVPGMQIQFNKEKNIVGFVDDPLKK